MPGSKVIAVVGAPGSKTAEVAQAVALSSGTGCTIIDIELYRRIPLAHGEFSFIETHEAVDYNHFDPSCYDLDKLADDLHNLKLGNSVVVSSHNPVEDSDSEYVVNEAEAFEPTSLIIIRGAFAQHTSRLQRLADKRVFVESDLGLCFERIIGSSELACSMDRTSALSKWNSKVVPKFNSYVLPIRGRSQYVVDGESVGMGEDFSPEELAQELMSRIRISDIFSEDSSVQNADTAAVNNQQPCPEDGIGHFGFGC